MSQSGGSEKASFVSISGESSPKSFTVQYNPKEFKVNKSLTWKDYEVQGQTANPTQFQKGAPMTASFDLIFDTTADGENVQTAWVEALLDLTEADQKPSDGEQAKTDKQRPGAYTFTWGDFSMDCVIESIDVTYLMFASTGQALRARCSVKLKEWLPSDHVAGSRSETWGTGKIELVSASGGETLSQIAAAAGAEMRDVASASGITDPLADLSGVTLAIPR
jgi:hypothetical protein